MRQRILKAAKFALLGATVLLGLLVATGLCFRAWRQHENQKIWDIHTPNGIQEGVYVPIGGIEQWIQIRGQDRDNPVLLFVHGGPGASTLQLSSGWLPWEKYFTVVQWDERGAGRTFGKTGTSIAPTMTTERMAQDGIEVAEYLRAHLHKKKIILVGHSWGSYLGIHMIKERPDLFFAYVGTGQIIGEPTWEKRDAIQMANLRTLAQAAGNADALKELSAVDGLKWDDRKKAAVFQKWAYRLKLPPAEGLTLSGPIPPPVMPGFTLLDWYYSIRGYRFSENVIINGPHGPMTKPDLHALGLDFSIPIFFFEGTQDSSTPIEAAEEYLEQVSAPHKEFVRFEGADHFLPLNRPDDFLQALLKRVRPLAVE